MAWRTLAQYQAALSASVYPINIELSGPEADFRGGLAARRVGSLSLVRAVANRPFHCQRRSVARNAHDGHFLLQLQESGATAYEHGGRFAMCEAESLVLMDARRSIIGEQFGPAEALVVRIPVRLLMGQLPRIEDYCSTAVSARTGSAAILAGMIRDFWSWNSALTDHDQQVLPELMLKLVEAVFYNSTAIVHDEIPDKARQFERLRKTIRDHARDPDLCCQRLCQILSVSRSSLYGLTRMAGSSIERMIIEERLAQSAARLRDPAWQDYSITDIAFAQGFRDLSHFSRRFKERFGLSPVQYRTGRATS